MNKNDTQYPITGASGIAQLLAGQIYIEYSSMSDDTVVILTGYNTTGYLTVTSRINGSGFEISSSNQLDTGSVAYLIIGGQ